MQYKPNHQKSNFFKNCTRKNKLKYPKTNDDANSAKPSNKLIASKPDENNSFFISLGVILENEGILCLRADFFLFPIISIDKIFLLAPLIILLILPLDGETNIISGLDFE